MNTRTDSLNVLRTAKVGSMLLIVQKDGHGKRVNEFLTVTGRKTQRGRHGTTILTLTNAIRENGASFDFTVDDATYDSFGFVAAHRVLDR